MNDRVMGTTGRGIGPWCLALAAVLWLAHPAGLSAQPADAPAADAPAAAPQAPAADAPAADAPAADAPAADAPAADAPAAAPQAPVADAPAAEAPAPEGEPTESPVPAAIEITDPAAEPAFDDGSDLEAEGEGEGDDVEEIVVTGSRIKKRSVFAASAPVEIISRQQLEYSGATNLADAVQYLTVAQGNGFQGAADGATTSVNLRGLGVGATLVLLNGRRLQPSGGGIASHYSDISTIPMAMVERIEILKGGASSIYGSDAVAGVINIITRKDWDGARLEADVQSTDDFDQRDYTLSAAFGASSERARVGASLQYFNRSDLYASERDFLSELAHSTQGYPGTFIAGAGLEPDPDCDKGPLSSANDDGFCAFDYRNYQSVLPRTERTSVLADAEYDVTHHTTVFTEVTVSRTRTDSVFSPSLPIPPLGGAFPTIPADHVDNPFGSDVQIIGRPIGEEGGPGRLTAGDDTFRAVVGIKGDFEGAAANTVFESWDWELFTSGGVSRYRQTFPDTLIGPYTDAVNSCSDPSDLSGCFNPFFSAQLGTGTPNSQEVIDSFSGTMENLTDHALFTYNGGMSGNLMELPGGDLGIAFGGEIRNEWRTSELDHDANEEAYAFFVGNSDAVAERDVYGAYLELVWPFYNGVELQTAGRLEHYTDVDSTQVNPTVGLTLTPAEIAGRENVVKALRRLQLRGHVASAFRAPTIYQSFPGFATVPALFQIDGQILPAYAPVTVSGNPELNAEKALAISAGLLWSPIDWLSIVLDYWLIDYKDRIAAQNAQKAVDEFFSGDLAVGPDEPRVEAANNTVSRVFTKNVNIGDNTTSGLDFALFLKFDGDDFGGNKDDFGTLSFGAQGTYTFQFDIPEEEISPDANFLGEYDCDGGTCSVVGWRNNNNFAPSVPEWRVNFPLTWASGGHSASLIGHFISAIGNDDADTAQNEADGTPTALLPEIDSWFSLDLQYGYRLDDEIGKATTIRVGIYNVTETEPPFVPSLAGFAGIHDPRGRMLYAKLIQEF